MVYQYCLKMWYASSLESASLIQMLTKLECKNGLVLSTTYLFASILDLQKSWTQRTFFSGPLKQQTKMSFYNHFSNQKVMELLMFNCVLHIQTLQSIISVSWTFHWLCWKHGCHLSCLLCHFWFLTPSNSQILTALAENLHPITSFTHTISCLHWCQHICTTGMCETQKILQEGIESPLNHCVLLSDSSRHFESHVLRRVIIYLWIVQITTAMHLSYGNIIVII